MGKYLPYNLSKIRVFIILGMVMIPSRACFVVGPLREVLRNDLSLQDKSLRPFCSRNKRLKKRWSYGMCTVIRVEGFQTPPQEGFS